jgi:hypothetical protein
MVAGRYLRAEDGSSSSRTWPDARDAPGDAVARLHSVRVLNESGDVSSVHDIRSPIAVEITYWRDDSTLRPLPALQFFNEEGTCLFASVPFQEAVALSLGKGMARARCLLSGNLLAEGAIFVLAAVVTYNPDRVHAMEKDAVSFQVVDKSEGDGVRGECVSNWPGLVRPRLHWDVMRVSDQGDTWR